MGKVVAPGFGPLTTGVGNSAGAISTSSSGTFFTSCLKKVSTSWHMSMMSSLGLLWYNMYK